MSYKNDDKMPVGYLTGTMFFGSLHYPNNKFRELKYVLQLALEGDQLERARKDYNLSVKEPNKHVPHPHVEIKRRVKDDKTKPPRIIDENGVDIPNTVVAGNGSKVKVKFAMYDNTKGKNGAYLDAVKVLELVEYQRPDNDAADFYTVSDSPELQKPEKSDTVVKSGSSGGKSTPMKKYDEMDDEIPF